MEPEGSLPHSQASATRPYSKHCACFLKWMFYREGLLAPRPTPKLEDHPLSAVHDCLFNLFAGTLHIGGRSSIRNLRTCHAVVTGTHYTWTDYNSGHKTYSTQKSLSLHAWQWSIVMTITEDEIMFTTAWEIVGLHNARELFALYICL